MGQDLTFVRDDHRSYSIGCLLKAAIGLIQVVLRLAGNAPQQLFVTRSGCCGWKIA